MCDQSIDYFSNSVERSPMTHSSEKSSPILILGCGYVGTAVSKKFSNVKCTRKSNFELGKRETWNPEILSVPPHGIVLWTFPAASTEEEEALAVELYDRFFQKIQVVIYGSTSSYKVLKPDDWITEENELDLSQFRTRTEERLRQKGACILQLAGIFGPGRNPIRWYQQGLIQTGLSYLNLIHLQDIVSVTEKVFQKNEVWGNRFILSNGKPKTHLEITEILKKTGQLSSEFSIPLIGKINSKKVSSSKIKKLFSLTDNDFIDFP